MSAIDDLLKANEAYYRTFTLGMLPHAPAKQIAILTCIDNRINVERMLGLEPGDAHILRNAGPAVTEDALRSLLVSHYLKGVKEFMLIGHTDCGMTTFTDEEFRARLERETGTAVVAPACFHAFTDPDDHVRAQVQKVRSHPWVPRSVIVRGFVYDVRTGRLAETRA